MKLLELSFNLLLNDFLNYELNDNHYFQCYSYYGDVEPAYWGTKFLIEGESPKAESQKTTQALICLATIWGVPRKLPRLAEDERLSVNGCR